MITYKKDTQYLFLNNFQKQNSNSNSAEFEFEFCINVYLMHVQVSVDSMVAKTLNNFLKLDLQSIRIKMNTPAGSRHRSR